MSVSKSQILFSIFLFYTVLTVIMGFIGGTIITNTNADYIKFSNDEGFFTDTILGDAFSSIITGYAILPGWLNTIIFTVPTLIVLWIGLTTVFKLDGGA